MLLARARAVRPQTLRSSTPAPCLHLARASLACAATSDAARYTPPTCFSRGTPPAHAAASPAPQHPRTAAVSGPTRPSPALCSPRRPHAPPLSLPLHAVDPERCALGACCAAGLLAPCAASPAGPHAVDPRRPRAQPRTPLPPTRQWRAAAASGPCAGSNPRAQR